MIFFSFKTMMLLLQVEQTTIVVLQIRKREKQCGVVNNKPLRPLSSVSHKHLEASNEKHAFYTQDLLQTDSMSWLARNRITKFHTGAQASH